MSYAQNLVISLENYIFQWLRLHIMGVLWVFEGVEFIYALKNMIKTM